MLQKNCKISGTLKDAALAVVTIMVIFIASCGQSAAPGSTNFTETSTGASRRPWGMAFSKDYSLLYVANSSQHSISIYNTAAMVEVGSITTTCKPYRMAFNSDYSRMFVSHDISGVNGGTNQCYYSQLSHGAMSDGSYLSVVDMSTLKVTKGIALTQVSNARDVVYDSTNDVVYVTGSGSSHGISMIDGTTDEIITNYTSSTGYFDITGMYPSKLIMDYTRNLMYIMAPTNNGIYFVEPDAPKSETFDLNTYNAQETGYCFGAERKNGCACDSDSDCASRKCDTTATLSFCASSCESNGGYPDGCTCSSDSDCRSGLCSSGSCMSYTKLLVSNVEGYCDRDTDDCYDANDDQFKSPNKMADLGLCDEPWDVEVLSDNTAYVSCYGNFDDDDYDPLLRVMWDTNGLAVNGSAVVTLDSARQCDRPTEITSDPSGRYVFVICFGNNAVLAINQSTGDVLKSVEVPSTPADIIASDDYFFVTSMSEYSIYRYPIADLPLDHADRPQVIKLKQ